MLLRERERERETIRGYTDFMMRRRFPHQFRRELVAPA
jgi:hypothetical protein